MIPLERTVAVLLAAGRSRRFGPDNKLTARLGDRAVVAHVAAAAAPLSLLGRIAVVPPATSSPDLSELLREQGFELVENDRPELGKDRSLRLGLAAALDAGAEAALVLLGDMPSVTPLHLQRLAATADERTAAMSATGDWRSPPVIIPAAIIRAFLTDPEQRLRDHLGKGGVRTVETDVELLSDCDTPTELAALEDRFSGDSRSEVASRDASR